MTSLAGTVARGGAVTVASQALGLVARMAGLVVLAHLIAPSAYGLVAIAQAIVLFASSIALMGLGMASVREAHLSDVMRSTLFWTQALVGLGIAAALWLMAHPLAQLYGHAELVSITRWLAVVPLLNGLQAQYRADLARAMRFSALAAAELLPLVGSLGLALGLAVAGFDYRAIIAQLIAQPALQLVMLALQTRWLPRHRPTWSPEARHVLKVGMHILAMNLLRNASRSAQTPAMGLTVPPAGVGNFDRAQQLVIVPVNTLIEQMQRVTVPLFSHLRHSKSSMAPYLARCQTIALLVPGAGFVIFAVMAPRLTPLVLGREWRAAGPILAVLCLGGALRILGQVMDWIFISAEDTRAGVRFSLWSQPAMVAVSLAGLPWGSLGVAVGNTVAVALYWPAATIVAARVGHFRAAPLLAQSARLLLTLLAPMAVAGFITNDLAASLPAPTWLLAGTASALVGLGCITLGSRLRSDARELGHTVQLIRVR